MTMRRKRQIWSSAAARRLLTLAGQSCEIEDAVAIVATRLLEGISCPPTDLLALGRRLNVHSVDPVAGLPISGELRKSEENFSIVYSSSLTPGRRQFTIAHELGHAVFESTGPNCPRYGNELERLCDMLAAEFLLPRQSFLDCVGAEISPDQVFRVARRFETSVMATALRFHTVLGASVFQVENGQIKWGFGAIRHQRDLHSDRTVLKKAFASAMAGEAGSAVVFVKGASHLLQWVIQRGQRRALFLVSPRKTAARAPAR